MLGRGGEGGLCTRCEQRGEGMGAPTSPPHTPPRGGPPLLQKRSELALGTGCSSSKLGGDWSVLGRDGGGPSFLPRAPPGRQDGATIAATTGQNLLTSPTLGCPPLGLGDRGEGDGQGRAKGGEDGPQPCAGVLQGGVGQRGGGWPSTPVPCNTVTVSLDVPTSWGHAGSTHWGR